MTQAWILVKKKTLLLLLKLTVSVGMLAYLFYSFRASKDYAETIDQLIYQPKDWCLLAGAWFVIFISVLLTFLRWYWLVRALDLPFRLRDGLRLGFLGFLFNFVSLGSVGGDLFKAVFLAHEHPGRRAEAISTIIIDRLIGLYGLLLLGSVVILSGQLPEGADIHRLGLVTLIGTGVITLLCAIMMWPGLLHGSLSGKLCGLPKVGPHVSNLLRAARTYRQRHGVLWASLAITMVVHVLNVAGFYFIARGLPGDAPTFASHMLIIPLAVLTSALPISLAGLGVFELAMQKLYLMVSPTQPLVMIPKLGLFVALIDRVLVLLIAAVGVFFYIGGRREVREVMQEVEQEAGDETPPGAAGTKAV